MKFKCFYVLFSNYIRIELYLAVGNLVVNIKKLLLAMERGEGVYTERRFQCGPAGRRINTLCYLTFPPI